MNYEIKRGNEIVWSGKAEGKQSRVIMQADMVEVTIKSPVAIAFLKGDTIQVYGETYKINRPENISRANTQIGYSYNVQFEALYYDLGKWILYTLDGENRLSNPDVYLNTKAITVLGLLVQNANRASSGWSLGEVDDTEVIQWSYNAAKLLTVLQDVADQTNLEFWVDGKTINLTRRQPQTGLNIAYGKGKGLYELSRNRRQDPIITHLTIAGGTRNIPNGYGYRNIQPVGGNPMVNPNYVEGEDHVEGVLVFENVYPRLNAAVTSISAINVVSSTDLNFKVDDHRVDNGSNPQIAFTSGQLNGFSFEILEGDFIDDTKTIIFQNIVDDNAYPQGIPNEQLRPSVGDTFVLLNINMPQSYVDAAEAKVKELGDQYFAEDGVEQYDWSGRLTPKFVIENDIDLVLGGIVNLNADDIGFNGSIRVDSYTRDLQQEYLYDFTLSNIITINKLVRERNMSDRLANTVSKGISQDGLSTKATFAERAGYAVTAGHANTATNAATAQRADHATNADNALRAQRADLADLATRALRSDIADYALDSDKWDGEQFADFIDQPVRKDDNVSFNSVGSKDFTSGFFGNGYRIYKDANGKYMAEFDRLTVRQDFNVYELIVNQLRSTNGSLIVSDGIKINGSTAHGSNYVCTIDTDGGTIGVPFRVDDILQTQVYNGQNMKYYVARVLSVDLGSFTISILDGSGIPSSGDDIVRIDSFTDNNRKGIVYITASDSGAPYIDTVFGKWTNPSSSVRVRMGRLDGITDSVMGQLSGYGLYAQNVFLRGVFQIETGSNVDTKQEVNEKIGAVDVGGVNLLLKSNVVMTKFNNEFEIGSYSLSKNWRNNTEYTLVFRTGNSGTQQISAYAGGGRAQLIGNATMIDGGITALTFIANTGNYLSDVITFYNETRTSGVAVIWAVLVEGNKSSLHEWVAAPQEINEEIEKVRSDAVAKFSVIDGQILGQSQSIDNLNGRVSTAEFKLTDQQINLTVSDQVNEKIGAVDVGGVNLLLKSNVVMTKFNNEFEIGSYSLSKSWRNNTEYTLVFRTGNSGTQQISAYAGGGRAQLIGNATMIDGGITALTFIANTGNYLSDVITFYNETRTSGVAVIWAVLVEGNKSSLHEWVAAPQEINEEIEKRQTQDQIKAGISIVPGGVNVFGQFNTFQGAVQFESLDQSAQGRITGSEDQINLWRKPGTTLVNGDVIDTDTLIARQMKTSKGANRLSINEGSDNAIKVRHTNGQVGIVMGLVAGQPTMTFYDNTGRKLWEAGQAGLVYVNTVAESWTTLQMFLVQSIASINDSLDVYNAGWQISAGMHRDGGGSQASVLSPYGTTRYIYSEGINNSSANNKQYAGYHTDQTKTTTNWIPNGWYIDGNVVMMQSGGHNVWETYAYKIFNGQLTGDSMIVTDIQWSDGW